MDPTNNSNPNPNVNPNLGQQPGQVPNNGSGVVNANMNGVPDNVGSSGAFSANPNMGGNGSNWSDTQNGSGVVTQTSTSASSSNLPNPNLNYTNPTATSVANPVYRPDSGARLAATDPIMKPEPAPAPDPVEEELKAPMKAAGPVPGSIGSAVSMPTGGAAVGEMAATPTENPFSSNVSFEDPAASNNMVQGQQTGMGKKKNSKMLLIILIVVLFLMAAGLMIFLIMQMNAPISGVVNDKYTANDITFDNNNNNNGSGGGSEGAGSDVDTIKAFKCVRKLSNTELEFYDVKDGELTVTATFDSNGRLAEAKVDTGIKSDGASEMEVVEGSSYTLDTLAASSDEKIKIDTSNIKNMTATQIMKEFESLDYVCKVL